MLFHFGTIKLGIRADSTNIFVLLVVMNSNVSSNTGSIPSGVANKACHDFPVFRGFCNSFFQLYEAQPFPDLVKFFSVLSTCLINVKQVLGTCENI